jgi:two-component system chemotaxis response regulator CheY
MMPKVDGVKVLKTIRDLERENKIAPEARSKVIMTTALGETAYVQQAFDIGCEAYASKPIDVEKLVKVLEKLELIQPAV